MDNDYPLIWKDRDILLSSSDSICLDGFLLDKVKKLINVRLKEKWYTYWDEETALRTVSEEEVLVKRRGFHIDTQTRETVYVLVLTCKYLDLLDGVIDLNNY